MLVTVNHMTQALDRHYGMGHFCLGSPSTNSNWYHIKIARKSKDANLVLPRANDIASLRSEVAASLTYMYFECR